MLLGNNSARLKTPGRPGSNPPKNAFDTDFSPYGGILFVHADQGSDLTQIDTGTLPSTFDQ